MAELLSPGVIIQEVPFGPQPVEGVSTSTAGFVGEALYGPTEGPPTLVTSFADFQRKFGGITKGMALGYAVQGFFENGGRRAYIVRVVKSGTPKSTLELSSLDGAVGGHLARILGTIAPAGATNEYNLTLSTTVGLGTGSNQLTLLDRRGSVVANTTLDVLEINPTTGVVRVENAHPTDPANLAGLSGERYYVRIGAAPSTPPSGSVLDLETRDPGSFGSRVTIYVEPVLGNSARILARASVTEYQLSDVSFLAAGQRVQLHGPGTNRAVAQIASINRGTARVTLGADPGANFVDGTLFLISWRITVSFDGVVREVFTVTSDPAGIVAEINDRSQWIRATSAALDPSDARGFPTLPLAMPAQFVFSGTDDPPTADDVKGSALSRTGLAALEAQDGINLIAAVGFDDDVYRSQTVIDALIGQAERLRDRFAVFESSTSSKTVTDVLTERSNYNSQYAAMYHPWVRVRDPVTGTSIDVPPSGHVLGAYARTDNERGVFKAPANVVLRGIEGFALDVTTGEQDVLNPAGVNVLRRFDGLGNVIWGARTISADALWKYVPVRRLFIFLEQSIARGTRYAVFEPNAPPLWARIRDSVTNFLTTQWRAGALFGRTPEEAFFVKVDETTTTQDDRDNGIVNIVVGIAPVKPAEFVVFQIGQAPSSVIIAES